MRQSEKDADPDLPRLPGVSHHYVAARGLRFHLAQAGDPAAETVLLLHGFPQHWFAWRRVIAELAPQFRVIALDLRGSGWSSAPAGGYDTSSRVADVLAVLAALGLPRVRLVGHEWGGLLGFQLCLAAPERFSRFVAVNAVHPWPRSGRLLPQLWRYWFTALFEYPWLGAWLQRTQPRVLRWLLRRGIERTPKELATFVDRARQPARARAGQQLHWQFVLHDIPRLVLRRDRHRRLRVPTVLLGGVSDFAFTARLLAGADHHADSLRVRVVPGGHYLPEEAPEVIADAVRVSETGNRDSCIR